MSTFRRCLSLLHVSIPSSVKSIKSGAFYMCVSLKNDIIPSSVTTIGFFAFTECTSLKIVKLSSNLKMLVIQFLVNANHWKKYQFHNRSLKLVKVYLILAHHGIDISSQRI